MKYLFLLLVSLSGFAGFSVNNQGTGSVGSTSTKILDPLSTREYFVIHNVGSGALLVKLGSAHVATEGNYVPSGSSWQPDPAPIDSIYIKASSGSATYHYIEGKK